jgi:multisubunit Na+/H+ antiporter MnhG subunit
VLLEILTWLLVLLFSVCTCGLGALLAVPVSAFYLQNAAYHKGLIR